MSTTHLDLLPEFQSKSLGRQQNGIQHDPHLSTIQIFYHQTLRRAAKCHHKNDPFYKTSSFYHQTIGTVDDVINVVAGSLCTQQRSCWDSMMRAHFHAQQRVYTRTHHQTQLVQLILPRGLDGSTPDLSTRLRGRCVVISTYNLIKYFCHSTCLRHDITLYNIIDRHVDTSLCRGTVILLSHIMLHIYVLLNSMLIFFTVFKCQLLTQQSLERLLNTLVVIQMRLVPEVVLLEVV